VGWRQRLTRSLAQWLPAPLRERMAADAIVWLFADLPPAERQARVTRLAPRLLARIQAGQIGLRLVVAYHLLRLPGLGRLRPWVLTAGGPVGCEPGPIRGLDGVAGTPHP
jgi:hypothetical protein